jgi:hypothetical protein
MSLFNEQMLTPQSEEFVRKLPSVKKDSETFVDEFELSYSIQQRVFLTDQDLLKIKPGSLFVFDVESYVNFWMVAFKHVDSGKYMVFANRGIGILPERDKLRWFLKTFLCVGFNSKTYDIPMVSLAIEGFDNKALKQASNAIIFGNLLPYQIEQHFKITLYTYNHIDLIEVCPLEGSLKLYAARLHCKRVQDLPIQHEATLTRQQMEEVIDYCLNDLDNTEILVKFLYPQLELRYTLSNQYGVDVRSKSDAQIAEAVISHELKRLTGKKPERPKNYSQYFFYLPPAFITFGYPSLKAVLQTIRDTPFQVGENGEIVTPEAIQNLSVRFGNCVYRFGMGGLHSNEKTIAHKSSDEFKLRDIDVVSYYPAIVVNQELHPKHLGKAYLEIYKSLIRRRVDAKKAGDKMAASSLKITVNGLFGKFGNKWSIVYSPDVLIQITISGQLCLLKLIEMIETAGIEVLSANTDGVVINCPVAMECTLDATVKQWEALTGFETEEARYRAIYSRDVNNYIAIKEKEEDEPKVKGSYSERGSSGDTILSKNPETLICNDAAINFVWKAKAVEETISECKDIRRFVTVRNVRGGAVKSGKYLGKTVRWYYSNKMRGTIRYVTSGNKVPNSDGAMPLMELPESNKLPDDLDYERYIRITNEILAEVGAIAPTTAIQGSLFST